MLDTKMIDILEKSYKDFLEFEIKSHNPYGNSVGLWPEEIFRLMWCEYHQPNLPTVILGSHNMASEVICGLVKQYKNDKSPVIGIDIEFGKYASSNQNRYNNRNPNFKITSVQGSSLDFQKHWIDLQFKSESEMIYPPLIGLAFLDSYHSYSHVIAEFQQIEPYLTSNSILAFHDCSPKYPKLGSKLPEDYKNGSQDFLMDEAINTILTELNHSNDFEELYIPVGNECYHPRETGLREWRRGTTSCNNSLFAIKYKELIR